MDLLTASSVPAFANEAAKSGISPFGARSSSSRMSSASGTFVVAGISPSMMTAVAFSFATSAPARRSPASSGAPIASASTRPRCRTPTVSVAFGSIGPSPPSTECVSPGTESPSPNPHSANDASVYPMSLDGRNASPTNPAASSSAPEAIASAAAELRRERPREQRRRGDRAHDRGALDRREAEHVDHEQHAEEQRADERPESIARATFARDGAPRASGATLRAGSRRRAQPNVATSAAPATGA